MKPKLADFGLAIDMCEERPNSQTGTTDYMAPEVLDCPLKHSPEQNKLNPNSAGYGTEVDVWALGAMSYEMMVGSPPFKGCTEAVTMELIRKGDLQFPKMLSADAKDLLTHMLSRSPMNRPTLVEMLRHPWLVNVEVGGKLH
jgi:serine/threonine protein kinase